MRRLLAIAVLVCALVAATVRVESARAAFGPPVTCNISAGGYKFSGGEKIGFLSSYRGFSTRMRVTEFRVSQPTDFIAIGQFQIFSNSYFLQVGITSVGAQLYVFIEDGFLGEWSNTQLVQQIPAGRRIEAYITGDSSGQIWSAAVDTNIDDGISNFIKYGPWNMGSATPYSVTLQGEAYSQDSVCDDRTGWFWDMFVYNGVSWTRPSPSYFTWYGCNANTQNVLDPNCNGGAASQSAPFDVRGSVVDGSLQQIKVWLAEGQNPPG